MTPTPVAVANRPECYFCPRSDCYRSFVSVGGLTYHLRHYNHHSPVEADSTTILDVLADVEIQSGREIALYV